MPYQQHLLPSSTVITTIMSTTHTPLENLPRDGWEMVLDLLPFSDLASVSRVSRGIQISAESFLYRTISLDWVKPPPATDSEVSSCHSPTPASDRIHKTPQPCPFKRGVLWKELGASTCRVLSGRYDAIEVLSGCQGRNMLLELSRRPDSRLRVNGSKR